MITNLIILLILLILSAFFSSAEVAFVTLTDAKVSSMIERKLPRAKLVKKLKSNARRLLVTILIGNNIVNIAASSFATVVAIELFESAAVGIATGVMTLLVLIFGEIIPKSYAASHAKKFAIFAAPFLHMLQLLLFPFVVIFEWITNIVAGKDMGDTVSEAELRALAKVSTEQGTIESDEGRMIERLFQFNDITAEDIMTPRVHIEYIEDTTTIDEATEIIINHPYTRYPVFHETRDTIIGFVHARDVLLAHHKDQEDDPIKGILHPIMSVPKQMRLDALMEEFQKRQTHMAVVVDEYGGTEGIVTFEDVIEELVGEIADEHDISENLIKRKDKTTVLVSGDTQIRDINDFLNVQIPGNELDTIAEVMLDELQKIPRKGQSVELGNTHCMIIETKKRRIQKVEVKRV